MAGQRSLGEGQLTAQAGGTDDLVDANVRHRARVVRGVGLGLLLCQVDPGQQDPSVRRSGVHPDTWSMDALRGFVAVAGAVDGVGGHDLDLLRALGGAERRLLHGRL